MKVKGSYLLHVLAGGLSIVAGLGYFLSSLSDHQKHWTDLGVPIAFLVAGLMQFVSAYYERKKKHRMGK